MKTHKQKAVSLRFPENFPAPFITASASGELAERLIDIAKKERIPIVKNGSLTEILSTVDVGTCIPEGTFEAVAKVFAFIIEEGNL